MDNLWARFSTAVRDRYERTAFAQFGAGLHLDCDDCATPPTEIVVPAPRQRSVEPAVAGVPERL